MSGALAGTCLGCRIRRTRSGTCAWRVSTATPCSNSASRFPSARTGTVPCGGCDGLMLAALWSGLGDKAADRWGALLQSPALAFWLVGVVAWVWSSGGLSGSAARWGHLVRAWNQQAGGQSVVLQVAFLVLALLVVTASARLGELSTLAV